MERSAAPAPAFEFIGDSASLRYALSLAEKCARASYPIVITGETGTGKTILAEYIHRTSRRSGRFVDLNCAAIPEELLESELFGTERGAYTSAATTTRPGFLESAERGTLFLDEIGEMPLRLQKKLLTVLNGPDSGFYHIGGRARLAVDVRFIVATSINLEAAVRAKSFSEALYYRLAVLNIAMPTLRERQEDVVPLISFFCARECVEFQLPTDCDAAVLERLRTYDWPGNVRQLENTVKRAKVYARQEGRVTIDDINDVIDESLRIVEPTAQSRIAPPSASNTASSIPIIGEGGKLFEWREVYECYIRTVWDGLGGKKSGFHLGRVLGMNKSTALRVIRKFGLN
jgi:transcriptional regulator with PAS, ATPase and Fis domain